ncbi:SNF2-related protein [uncultured Treponema sp.]|uniref:SNF2-related protein n=1 Tax=uncultured Treponema sp. TaxID=162155 RepID=UPI002593586A|nr:SNF2-related protein [uncultured Treponema sp.]
MKTNTIFENENITIRKNIEKHGIEVLFPSRPSDFERQLLKDSGFRWSNPQKLWWSRENDLTEKYIENEIERQNGLKKIKDWEEFKNESNERLEQEIQQTDIFSPESFLAGFNQDVQKLFDNNQFVDYDVNNNSTTSLQHGVKEELSDEGNETSGNKGSKSEEPYGNVGRGSSESNAEQFIDRSSSEMGGDSGSRYRGTGYRDDIREHETGWNSNASSSDYSSLSSGQIPGTSEQTDSKTGDGLRVQNLHKREVDNGISENNGSDEQSGHGDERSNGLSETPEEENSVLNNLNKNSNPWFEKLSESQKEAVLSDMKINPDLIGEYHTELSENNILFNEYNKPTEEWLLRKINYKNHEGEFSYFNENNAGQKKHYEEVFSEYKSEHKTLSRTESKDIRKEVKELLHSHSDEEIKSNAKWLNLLSMYEGGGGLKEQDSTSAEALNAFYTPRNVVEAVWKLADTYAPNARTVLEPSSGIGRFAENRPNNNFTLRELDETSARIARILYPDADVIQGAFQAQFFDDEGVVRNKNYELPKYDLVIGNPPYGEYTGEWKGKGEGKEFNRYEEYFIAKGLDSLKDENSVLAFVVPSGFLNSSNDKIKKLIAEKGELIDAYRLPEGTFPTTKVGTDIIVMRNWEKRHKDIIELNKAAPDPFKKNPDEELQKAKENMAGVLSNGDYFEFHTDKVLGEIKTRTNRFGKEEQYVTVHEGLTVQDELNKIKLMLPIYLDKQIEKTVSEENNKSQSKEIPETKTSRVKKEKSHIEKALEKYLNSENDISTDENVRNLLGIRGDFEVKDFKTWSDRTWRASSGKWDWTPHFDVDTKQVLITTAVENTKTEEKETKLYAVLYPDGNVKKLYDEYSDEFASLKLSMAKQQRLNDIINHFNFNWQPVMDGFLGMKDNKAYFATTQRGVSSEISEAKYSSWRDELKVFSSVSLQEIKTRNPFNAVLVDNNYNENDYDTSSRRNDDYSEIPVFAKLQTLFPKYGNVNLSNIDDDNAMAHLAGDEIDIPEEKSFYSDFGGWGGSDSDERWEKYLEYGRKRDEKIKERWNAALNEVVKASGCSTKDEYFNKAETLIKERHQKKLAALEEKTKIRQQEEDADIVLNEVLKNPLVPGIKEYSVAGYAILYSQNKDDHEAVDVLIDGNKCLTLNKNANLVTTYNNYFVTSNFIKNVSDLWEKIPSVRNVEVEDVKLSLNKLLEGKHFSQKSIEEGSAVSNAVLHMEKDQNETVLKTAQASYSIKKSGTIQKVFAEKSNYPLFEFNNKTNILKFYQNSYEKGFGFISGAEDVFKQTFEKLSVIKDITINGSRYIDVDGNTIEAPAKSERYTPVKEKIMDNAEFANTYGKNWNKEERAFWAATDYKGYVDLSKLTQEERKILETSPNYCIDPYIAADGTLVGGNKYIHKELYASGNIYKKLDLIEKLHNKSDMAERVYQKNKAILEAALPVPLKLDELELSVNSPFIRNFKLSGEAITERFIKWATGYDLEDSQNNREQISDFSSAGISREDIPPTITWEDVTNYIDGIALPAIRDDSLDEKEKSQIRNRKINDRQETAEKLFTRYIKTVLTEEEGKSLSDAYNRQFNGSRDPDYAKLPLFIDGMNLYRKGSHFHLYEQQIKGISFLCNKGNGILAYDVGVGKTAAGIVATVQQIQSGRCKRPLIIVPKSVIGKWESDIHELFPNIPVNNLENFSRSSTGAFYNKANHGLNIPAGSITLTTKEVLNNIHWNKATIDKYLFNDYADLLGLTEKLSDPNPKVRAETKEKIYEEASGKVRDENYIEWINTGFDHVTVDEAHAYKKLERKPRASKDKDGKERISEFNRIVGSGEPSGIAKKMFNVTQIIQQQNENRNVFMLTATPFTNSPLEVYSMLVYVARKEMENCGIKNLNDFCSQYAKTRFERVVKPNGNVEMATVMKEWGDLHGLQNILKQYIDKVDGEEAGIIRPEKKTHKVNLEATELQKDIFDFAINHVMTHKPDKENGEKGAPVLEAMNMMRTACLSPALLKQEKLVNPNTKEPLDIKLPPIEQIVDCSPKLKLVCDTVISNWKKHQDCGQIIYMPEGTDSYPYVIDYMVKQGVPREVFASIDGQSAKIGGKNVKIGKEDDTDDVRAKVADAFNDKKNPCKILIGSAAISEGMDLNGNSVALYNTMMGWNPTECIQVEGRIWRQGNQQGHVHIVYPLIYDSIDSLLFQKHDEKDSRINQLFNYKGNTLNVADLDPEKLKYELIKDPTVRAKMQIDDVAAGLKNELLMLDSRLSDYDSLVESKIRFTEKLSEKESSKQNYIENHAKSVANGNPNRSEEEQKAGLERFDKSINDIKKQIENIRRKYAEMGIENDSDKTEYVNKINVAKQKKQEELNKLYGEENFQKVVNSMKKDIADEKAREFENALLNPLDKTIQEDMLPFHVVERSVKEARYREAMRKSQNNELEQNALTEQFNEYLSEYEKKWGSGVKEEAKNNISQPTVSKSEPVAQKSETKTSEEENIIHVINQEIEVFDNKRDEEAQSQGMLFASEEPAVITRALNNTHVDWRNSNCSNFSENLSEVFRLNKKDITKEAVMKVAGKLIAAMPKDEKEKFIKLTSQMNIKGKTETSKFLIKVAKGELKLQPGKKPPVVQKNQENVEYDIF